MRAAAEGNHADRDLKSLKDQLEKKLREGFEFD